MCRSGLRVLFLTVICSPQIFIMAPLAKRFLNRRKGRRSWAGQLRLPEPNPVIHVMNEDRGPVWELREFPLQRYRHLTSSILFVDNFARRNHHPRSSLFFVNNSTSIILSHSGIRSEDYNCSNCHELR
ncbi:hypothetical protein Tcan_00724, partial [Toxocara canis]